jgi:uncharacterized protein YcnI
MNSKRIVAAVAVTAVLGAGATAAAHTTISSTVSGPLLTSARGSYVVRSPNETTAQSTWKVVMYVPKELQTAISIKQLPDWKARLKTADTGTKDADGNPVLAITQVSWTAKTRDDEIPPHFYGEWPVRFQNPAVAGKYCFGFSQYYTNADGTRRKPQIVAWTGAADSPHPSSCLTVTDAPPAS